VFRRLLRLSGERPQEAAEGEGTEESDEAARHGTRRVHGCVEAFIAFPPHVPVGTAAKAPLVAQ
jgi:hypothetical protein